MEKKTINGICIYTPNSRAELIDFAVNAGKILVAVNAEKILNADNQIRYLVNSNIGYPDGIGTVWAIKRKGKKNVFKIPGCELWLDIVEKYYTSKTFYFIGAEEKVINSVIEKIQQKFEGIKILGHRNGFFKSINDENVLLNDIFSKKPDIVFVAMGSPRQELIMDNMRKKHKAMYMGLGGSFDIYSNNSKRAPKWWLNNNLEWAYRLMRNPSRIKRQIYLIRFFLLLKMNRL